MVSALVDTHIVHFEACPAAATLEESKVFSLQHEDFNGIWT
ncbi:hypothetical protein MtrunA17_Chr5g0415431 [Medicago truncatula]|uniref:Uncharacterized protein n=1 Tax=Medicago truncatula TaxID=3880 RepID=A0A396HRS8_MEDTR|nr:hypothetical protein MtrunA17_Chr5g0415431 [Medicago truncatula]